jgi:20S proteasome alpha/beta subunit
MVFVTSIMSLLCNSIEILICYKHFDLVQRDQGVKLVVEAICAGIFNDLGSGSNVDVCVITRVSSLMPNPTSCLRGCILIKIMY